MPTDSVKEAVFATNNERKNLSVKGAPFKPIKTFTKNDFLDAERFAKKFSINKELVKKTLGELQTKNKKFVINGHLSNIVIKTPDNKVLVHPLAFEVILQQIEKQKAK